MNCDETGNPLKPKSKKTADLGATDYDRKREAKAGHRRAGSMAAGQG
jgi:hypothetical protein